MTRLLFLNNISEFPTLPVNIDIMQRAFRRKADILLFARRKSFVFGALSGEKWRFLSLP